MEDNFIEATRGININALFADYRIVKVSMNTFLRSIQITKGWDLTDECSNF